MNTSNNDYSTFVQEIEQQLHQGKASKRARDVAAIILEKNHAPRAVLTNPEEIRMFDKQKPNILKILTEWMKNNNKT